jgi:hypothetical protein
LNNYEANYAKRIAEAREKEVFYLRRELAVWASTLFVMVLSPVLATAATFSVYVLVSEDNILTAAMSFSVLLLFAALRFPINYAGRFVGSKWALEVLIRAFIITMGVSHRLLRQNWLRRCLLSNESAASSEERLEAIKIALLLLTGKNPLT